MPKGKRVNGKLGCLLGRRFYERARVDVSLPDSLWCLVWEGMWGSIIRRHNYLDTRAFLQEYIRRSKGWQYRKGELRL